MTNQNGNNHKVLEVVEKIVNKYGSTRDELIPILNEINKELGYVPSEALEHISRMIKAPKSQLFGVTTFYRMLSTKKRGKHVIQFCESAPCHVVGGREVWQALQENLNLAEDDTSADGKWTLITTSCLGLCGVGPVIVVDEDIYGNVTPEQVSDILAKYN
jgi:NADH:ubiquinone oxidoreductase subunit E